MKKNMSLWAAALLLIAFSLPGFADSVTRKMSFVSATYYCDQNSSYEQLFGRISVYNPHKDKSVEVTINHNLKYQQDRLGGKESVDRHTDKFTLAPGDSVHRQIHNKHGAFACHGIAQYFGDIIVTGPIEEGVRASGGFLILETNKPGSERRWTNLVFSVSDGNF